MQRARARTTSERVALGAVALVAFALLAKPLFQRDPAYFYFDDFFYYLVPARHFLATGVFSFDYATPTNGFHPLWMAVVTALLAVSRGHALVFFALFDATIAALLVASYAEAERMLRERGASATLAIGAGLVVLGLQIEIGTRGMEVALATPLLLAFTRRILAEPLGELRPARAATLGLLGAGAILARLDAVLLVLPLAIAVLRDRPAPRALAWVALGALPLAAYLGANVVLTHHLLPISGAAKTLRTTFFPSSAAIASIVLEHGKFAVITPLGYLAFAAWALTRSKVDEPPRERAIVLAAFAGVVLYYAFYSCASDWGLWFWYKYPLAWLVAVAATKLARAESRAADRACAAAGVFFVCASLWLIARFSPRDNAIYRRSLVLADFIRAHPGRWAMGDCAGTVAWELDEPLLQTEGLVADETYLDFVRRERPLGEALRHYRVDYYVASKTTRDGDCYLAREPVNGGPTSKKMAARICTRPLFETDGDLVFRASDVP